MGITVKSVVLCTFWLGLDLVQKAVERELERDAAKAEARRQAWAATQPPAKPVRWQTWVM